MENINAILTQLYQQQSLSQTQSEQLFSAIIQGEVEPIVLSSLLTALKIKGETPDEIAGAATALIAHATPFPHPDYDFADIVGTGGDGANCINISTTAAFVASACGVKIAKHGNRSVSSQSGSSDLLAAFGIDLAMSPASAKKALDTLGLCFLFAPHYHAGVRFAMPVRTALKTRTIFNLLGPLINPAKPPIELMGVYDSALITPIANTMKNMGFKRAAVVHGSGLDEVAIHGETEICEINNGKLTHYRVMPEDFGVKTQPLSSIAGGSPDYNREIIARILQGKGSEAQQTAVAINVALLLRLFGQENLKHNTEQALAVMQSGKPYQLMQQLAAWSCE